MTMPVECLVEGVPRSPSAASCPQWQEKVRAAAKQQWSGPLVSTQVIVVITCFSYGAAPVDVDNMAKPILDALKGVLHYDDRPVRDLVSRHRNCSDNDTYTTNRLPSCWPGLPMQKQSHSSLSGRMTHQTGR